MKSKPVISIRKLKILIPRMLSPQMAVGILFFYGVDVGVENDRNSKVRLLNVNED